MLLAVQESVRSGQLWNWKIPSISKLALHKIRSEVSSVSCATPALPSAPWLSPLERQRDARWAETDRGSSVGIAMAQTLSQLSGAHTPVSGRYGWSCDSCAPDSSLDTTCTAKGSWSQISNQMWNITEGRWFPNQTRKINHLEASGWLLSSLGLLKIWFLLGSHVVDVLQKAAIFSAGDRHHVVIPRKPSPKLEDLPLQRFSNPDTSIISTGAETSEQPY